MNKITIALVAILILVGGFVVYNSYTDQEEPKNVTSELDAQIACEGALAYMLFQTGEEADEFVAECIAGEHPEVVERYIKDRGASDSTDTPKDSLDTPSDSTNTPQPNIEVTAPAPEQTVSSPIEVKGQAQGNWFFEANAPVVVVDWDGLIIGEGYIEAQGNWMTEEFVPFTGSIDYDLPPDTVYERGTVIFRRANPSGLPENDQAVEVPVNFAETVSSDQSNAVTCTEEMRSADFCTTEYAPVCGLVQVQCITTPCDPVPETFSNSCAACTQDNVISYTEGACEV